jgi:S4 domain
MAAQLSAAARRCFQQFGRVQNLSSSISSRSFSKAARPRARPIANLDDALERHANAFLQWKPPSKADGPTQLPEQPAERFRRHSPPRKAQPRDRAARRPRAAQPEPQPELVEDVDEEVVQRSRPRRPAQRYREELLAKAQAQAAALTPGSDYVSQPHASLTVAAADADTVVVAIADEALIEVPAAAAAAAADAAAPPNQIKLSSAAITDAAVKASSLADFLSAHGFSSGSSNESSSAAIAQMPSYYGPPPVATAAYSDASAAGDSTHSIDSTAAAVADDFELPAVADDTFTDAFDDADESDEQHDAAATHDEHSYDENTAAGDSDSALHSNTAAADDDSDADDYVTDDVDSDSDDVSSSDSPLQFEQHDADHSDEYQQQQQQQHEQQQRDKPERVRQRKEHTVMRLAKRIAKSGKASRREAEKWIEAGRVQVSIYYLHRLTTTKCYVQRST